MNVIHLYGSYCNNEKIIAWGQRLRIAMGEKEILSRDCYHGGEFRPPTYRAYAEALDYSWNAKNSRDNLHILSYNTLYDGWKNKSGSRSGFMASAVNSYEYAYDQWDQWTKEYHPDLLDDSTFGCWLQLLPQPASVLLTLNSCTITWNSNESRVFRSTEMGRYTLPQSECYVSVVEDDWRSARVEAYVKAWEKMAANEPNDRYESIILSEQKLLKVKWNS
jgi:hypothetical protein